MVPASDSPTRIVTVSRSQRIRLFGDRLPLIRQATAAECGLACLAMLATWFGHGIDLVELRRRFPGTLRGLTATGLRSIAEQLGMNLRAVSCSLEDLAVLDLPCILHWRFDHFVVLKAVNRDGVTLHDPARGVRRVSRAQLDEEFTGIALLLKPADAFEQRNVSRRLTVGDLLPGTALLNSRFALGVGLALVAECLMLLSPLYLQTVVDSVIGQGDQVLLKSLLLAFALLLVFQVATNVMRALTFQLLTHTTAFDMASRLVRHLLRLPVRFFRQRDLGDLQHRFQAFSGIQAFVVQTAPMFVIDLIFVALLLALLASTNGPLLLLNLVAIGVWVVWRAALQPRRSLLAGDLARAEAGAQAHFLESLRAMPTLVTGGAVARRDHAWCGRFADTLNARVRLGNLGILDGAVQGICLQGARLASIYLLAIAALEGRITVGLLSATVVWLGMLHTRVASLVAAVFSYRLLRIPLERLSDIVFALPDKDGTRTAASRPGLVEVRDVAFRYPGAKQALLSDCSFTIDPGQMVAIAGASGCGKSTLLHLLSALEQPQCGEVRIGGIAISEWRREDLHRVVACVMHDDVLLKGSIADNISLLDDDVDMQRVEEAAKVACIAEVIDRLPMRFETRVADLGVALSAGQVQRLLLARALYRDPEILLLDEVSSGLDAGVEQRVIRNLKSLTCTRIVVTHSDRMLEAADAVFWVHRGTLVPTPPSLGV